MGLLDDLKPPVKIPSCRVRDLAAELGGTDGKILLDAAKDPAWSVLGLSDALRGKGLSIGAKALATHRGDKCSCRLL
jgi:hypothetical protein